MSQEANMRRVTAIKNGTVIDHVPAGKALSVLKMLGIGGNMSNPVSLVMNVPSKKMGGKDIIKVEDRELTQNELDRLALVAPDASVAIIRAYKVAEKLEINLDKKNIITLPMHARARLGIGYLPQQPSIFRGLSVEDNIMSILETRKYTVEQKQNNLEELLTEFSLTHLRRAMPYMLSGGERRRTEIARCLASDPKLILMDEPTAGVDPLGISDIKNLIKQLIKKNIGVLITDHNVREVLDICDYSYVLHSGEVIAEGESDKIIGNKDARKLYLGDSFKV